MSFFTIFFLYFLPLISIPIIIHLLGKNRVKTVRFSSLKFLEQLKNDTIKKLKLRQIILLIIRTLLILLIILFFARPYKMSTETDILPKSGETLHLLIDNSHSMSEIFQDHTILQSKLQELIELGNKINYPISLQMQFTTNPDNIINYGIINNSEEFKKAISSVTSTQKESELNTALEKILSYSEDNKILSTNLWIISDFQQKENYLNNLNFNFSKIDENARIRTAIFPVNHKENNTAIQELIFPEQIIEINKNVLLQSKLQYWQDYQKTTVSLFVENERVAQDITEEPNESVDFEFIPLKTGSLSGFITLPNDALLMDNKFYFALEIPERIDVLLITSNGRDNSIIEKALQVGKETIISLQTISPQILSMENLNDYDVLIFHGVEGLQDSFAEKLKDFYTNGRGIIYIPQKHTNIKLYNEFWHQKAGLPEWENTIQSNNENYLKINSINQSHPIFSKVWQDKNKFQNSSQFFSAPIFRQDKSSKQLMNYSNNAPFLMESNKKLLLSVFINSEDSNFRLSGFFPVLLQQMVLYLTNSNDSFGNYVVGDTLTYRNFSLENINNFTIKTPDNRSFVMDYAGNSNQLIFTNTGLPGFYKLYDKDKNIRNFGVNISKNETSGQFLSQGKIKEIIKDFDQSIVMINDANTESNLKINKELNGIFLFFILLLLIAETVIARINQQKSKGLNEKH